MFGNSVIKWCLMHEQDNTVCHCCVSVRVRLIRLLKFVHCMSHLPAFLSLFHDICLPSRLCACHSSHLPPMSFRLITHQLHICEMQRHICVT